MTSYSTFVAHLSSIKGAGACARRTLCLTYKWKIPHCRLTSGRCPTVWSSLSLSCAVRTPPSSS